MVWEQRKNLWSSTKNDDSCLCDEKENLSFSMIIFCLESRETMNKTLGMPNSDVINGHGIPDMARILLFLFLGLIPFLVTS